MVDFTCNFASPDKHRLSHACIIRPATRRLGLSLALPPASLSLSFSDNVREPNPSPSVSSHRAGGSGVFVSWGWPDFLCVYLQYPFLLSCSLCLFAYQSKVAVFWHGASFRRALTSSQCFFNDICTLAARGRSTMIGVIYLAGTFACSRLLICTIRPCTGPSLLPAPQIPGHSSCFILVAVPSEVCVA